MSEEIQYQISMQPEIASYFYAKYAEYVERHPDEQDVLTYGKYLGNVVLGSLKALFEGEVPSIYDPFGDDPDEAPEVDV